LERAGRRQLNQPDNVHQDYWRKMTTCTNERVAAWRLFCRILRERQAHETRLTRAQAPTLSLPAYAQLTRLVHAFPYPETPGPTQHTYAHPITHPPPSGEHHNHLDVAHGLESRPTIQLQGNVLRPRVIRDADDNVLLLPRTPLLSPLCLLFYDAPLSLSLSCLLLHARIPYQHTHTVSLYFSLSLALSACKFPSTYICILYRSLSFCVGLFCRSLSLYIGLF